MAVASGGFSIREYVSKKRSDDVGKCWPFGGDLKDKKREEIESSLPPISCRKHRWWLDELEVVKSANVDEGKRKVREEDEEEEDDAEKVVSVNESGLKVEVGKAGAEMALAKDVLGVEEDKVVKICPVCRSFTAATVNAVNAHIDSCLAQVSRDGGRQMKAAIGQKAKSRAPKKRSIMEIFAVAPPIGAADGDDKVEEPADDHHEEEFQEDGRQSSKVEELSKVAIRRKRKNNRLEEEAVSIVSKLKLKTPKKKRKKKKKRTKKDEAGVIDRSDRLGAKKGKLKKLKLQSSRKLKVSSCNKRPGKEITDSVSISKKKPSGTRNLSKQYRSKTVQSPMLISRHQPWDPLILPVHSILKNQSKVISWQNSAIGDIQAGHQVNIHFPIQSGRHVSFSGKDDIIGPMKNVYSNELPHLQSLCKAFSDVTATPVIEHMRDCDINLSAMEVTESSQDTSISTGSKSGIQPLSENLQLVNVHDDVPSLASPTPSKSFQEKEKNAPDKSVDLNQALLNSDNLHLFNQVSSSSAQDLPSGVIPRLLQCTANENFSPVAEIQGGNFQRAPNKTGDLSDQFGDSIPRSGMSSMENVKSTSQLISSSLSLNEETNGRHPTLSQSSNQSTHVCDSKCRSFCPIFPTDLKSSICSSMDWKKQRGVSCHDKCADEDFIGLPLNSHGELIQLHSRSNGSCSQIKKQRTQSGFSSHFPVHNFVLEKSTRDHLRMTETHFAERALPNDHSKMFPAQNFLKACPNAPESLRFAFDDLQSVGRTEVSWRDSVRETNHSLYLLDSEVNPSNILRCACGQYNQMSNQNENVRNRMENTTEKRSPHSTQPTMRLMGQDVTVGRSNNEVQGSEDGKIWTDKEVITERRPSMVAPANSSQEGHLQQDWNLCPATGKPKETVSQTLEAQRNPASQRFLWVKGTDSGFSPLCQEWQMHPNSKNGPLLSSGYPGVKWLPVTSPIPSSAWLNQTPMFSEESISGAESLKRSSQTPVPASTSYDGCQHMLSGAAEANYTQSLHHGVTSARSFPFSHQNHRDYVQPSWAQGPPNSMPHWLLNATQQNETSISSQAFYDADPKCYSHTISGNNFLITPSQHPSLVPYPLSSITSHSHMQPATGQASSVHPQLIPVLPGLKSAAINMNYRNRVRVKEQKKSMHLHLKDLNHSKRAKKRPPARANDSTKASKKLNLEMHEDSSGVKWSKERENFTEYMQCNMESRNLDLDRGKSKDVDCYSVQIRDDGLAFSCGFDFSKLDGGERSGPVKLSAGAKHILKPSQSIDCDNSMPTHSTIPFGALSNSNKALEYQKKSAKVYKF